MENTASDVKLIIQSLQNKVDEIPKQINDLNDKVTQQLIKTEIGKTETPILSKDVILSKNQVIEFVKNSSANGVLVIYTAAKANDTDKVVNMNDLFFNDSLINPSYMFGYLIATRSFSVFKADYKNEDIKITDCIVSASDIHPILIEKINRPSLAKFKHEYLQLLNKIDDYFND